MIGSEGFDVNHIISRGRCPASKRKSEHIDAYHLWLTRARHTSVLANPNAPVRVQGDSQQFIILKEACNVSKMLVRGNGPGAYIRQRADGARRESL